MVEDVTGQLVLHICGHTNGVTLTLINEYTGEELDFDITADQYRRLQAFSLLYRGDSDEPRMD